MEIRSNLVSDPLATTSAVTPVVSSSVNTNTSSQSSVNTEESKETKKPGIELVSDSNATKSPSTDSGIKSTGEFADFMRIALGGAVSKEGVSSGKNEVSEEELFSGLVEHGLSTISKDASNYFAEEKVKLLSSMRNARGNVSYEEVTIKALNEVVTKGLVSKEDAEKINGQAFKGAQLDSNTDSLFDHIGSDTDLTKAVAGLESAITRAKEFMDKNGKENVESRSLGLSATGGASISTTGLVDSSILGTGGSQTMSTGGGFVWKPVSESDKKLAVVLPEVLANLVSKVEIHSSLPPTDATKITEGRFVGNANGGRPHFRFGKPGGEYGDDLHVVAYKNDGTTLNWGIKDGSKRYD